MASAKQIGGFGQTRCGEITVEDFFDPLKIFAGTAFNADGIITKISCGGDKELENVLSDIILVEGGKPDRSGEIGVDESAIREILFRRNGIWGSGWMPLMPTAQYCLWARYLRGKFRLEKVADK
ncbi:MAG: hypothetical protein ACLUKN_01860 [Bacilli bacterium]